MYRIDAIVEGRGEVEAFPVLLRSVFAYMGWWEAETGTMRQSGGCGKLLKPGGIEKFMDYSARSECDGVIVLTDADEKIPCRRACHLAERIRSRPYRIPVAVVCANCEYEAWFLASLPTIAGRTINGREALPFNVEFNGDCESLRDVKGWLGDNFVGSRRYKETFDQASMTALIDIDRARENARSFRRLLHAVEELREAIEKQEAGVTPYCE